jgi:hypothetical protein
MINYIINYRILYKEHFCKIAELDNQDEVKDPNVLLNYKPQSNIKTSSCDKDWKKWPKEYNNLLIDDGPIVMYPDQLSLPKEKQFANNTYNSGLIDFNVLADLLSDKVTEDLFKISEELLIDPVTKEKLKYHYELEFTYYQLNKKTFMNRWKEYNPSVKQLFDYNQIKSPIENINRLNLEFQDRINIRQQKLLTDQQLILYGLIKFEIYKYKIVNIYYKNTDPNQPMYVIEMLLFREQDLYGNSFSYLGYIDPDNNKPVITNVNYIGINSSDSFLLSDFYNDQEITQEIINTNFSNQVVIEKDPDAIVTEVKKYEDSFKLKNQYACFNLNYTGESVKSENNILAYYSRESCESPFDPYGRPKLFGVYDTPCKSNEECPFYRKNKNYDNDFGKCMENGFCELPSNMKHIGYHYFSMDRENQPLCYNCYTNTLKTTTLLDSCCNEQQDKDKYPFLESADYAFNDDNQHRVNYFYQSNCYTKDGDIICKDDKSVDAS